jgi:molybdenum cofactor cytidylyltransferase
MEGISMPEVRSQKSEVIYKQVTMGSLWAIILAAGESKRMGSPKMLLPFKGITMLEYVIRNVTESAVDNILVVLGAEREVLTELLSKSSVKYCFNDNYKEGMLSSVKCGFGNLPSDFEVAMIFQGDQPLISSTVINKVIEGYRSHNKGIVIPVYKRRRGHPILIDRKYLYEIEMLDNNEGLRSLSRKFSEDVLEVESDDPGILRDLDTYEEYKKELNQIQ